VLYVYGDGPKPATCMLIGERPGKEESQRGRPFVGKSGKELDRYLLEGGLHRSDIYVTNLCKSYSPANEDPTPEEIKQDEHLLIEELKTVRPKYLGLVGRFAARYFLGDDLEMDWSHGLPFVSSQGRFHMMPLYHPAFGLHSPGMTPLVWSDFQAFCWMVKGETVPRPPEDERDCYKYILLAGSNGYLPAFRQKPIYMDTEGSPEQPWGLSFTQRPREGYVIRAHQANLLNELNRIIKQYDLLVVLHNAFHDIAVLRSMGIEGFRFTDTMVKAYHLCLFPQGLKPLSRRLCGMVQDDYEDVIGEADKEKKIQWLIGAYEWVNNRWPEESKMQLRRKTLAGSGRRSKGTSLNNVVRSNENLVLYP
jgi:uracil-DNA glycosylase